MKNIISTIAVQEKRAEHPIYCSLKQHTLGITCSCLPSCTEAWVKGKYSQPTWNRPFCLQRGKKAEKKKDLNRFPCQTLQFSIETLILTQKLY